MTGHIATYLNDHLAGATAGVEIAHHLAGSLTGAEKQALETVKLEIEKDHQTLKTLMHRLDIEESSIRKAAGWLSEKATELKLRVDDEGEGEFRVFEALELLSLGIEGKHCLWSALELAGIDTGSLDLRLLKQRASDQRAVVEKLRGEAAARALTS